MATLDYLTCTQLFLAMWVIAAIGFLCGKIKMFKHKEIDSIRKLIYLVIISAFFFQYIGNAKLDKDAWVSFGHAALVYITINIIAALVGFLWPSSDKKRNIVLFLLTLTQNEVLFYGWGIGMVLFDTDTTQPSIKVHAVMHGWMQFLLEIPLQAILAYLWIPSSMDPSNLDEFLHPQDEGALAPKERDDQEGNELEEVDDRNLQETDATGNPISKEHQAKTEEEEEQPEDVPDAAQEEKPEPTPMWKLILFKFVNPMNVCAILGIIWSVTPWDMWKFLDSFVSDLSKSCIGAGIFCTGVVVALHPFKGADWKIVVFGVLFHAFIFPLVSIAYSYALGQPARVGRYLALVSAAPSSFASYHMAHELGFSVSHQSYVFYWTVALSFPIYMIWSAILNETGLFA